MKKFLLSILAEVIDLNESKHFLVWQPHIICTDFSTLLFTSTDNKWGVVSTQSIFPPHATSSQRKAHSSSGLSEDMGYRNSNVRIVEFMHEIIG